MPARRGTYEAPAIDYRGAVRVNSRRKLVPRKDCERGDLTPHGLPHWILRVEYPSPQTIETSPVSAELHCLVSFCAHEPCGTVWQPYYTDLCNMEALMRHQP